MSKVLNQACGRAREAAKCQQYSISMSLRVYPYEQHAGTVHPALAPLASKATPAPRPPLARPQPGRGPTIEGSAPLPPPGLLQRVKPPRRRVGGAARPASPVTDMHRRAARATQQGCGHVASHSLAAAQQGGRAAATDCHVGAHLSWEE